MKTRLVAFFRGYGGFVLGALLYPLWSWFISIYYHWFPFPVDMEGLYRTLGGFLGHYSAYGYHLADVLMEYLRCLFVGARNDFIFPFFAGLIGLHSLRAGITLLTIIFAGWHTYLYVLETYFPEPTYLCTPIPTWHLPFVYLGYYSGVLIVYLLAFSLRRLIYLSWQAKAAPST